MATLGKAIGTFGAFVAGSDALIETLVQRARTYIYTTALPPAVAAASREALAIARTEEWRRERLREHVARFRAGACALGLALMPSSSPIQPLVIGHEAAALSASESLFEAGVWVPAIRPPTVPASHLASPHHVLRRALHVRRRPPARSTRGRGSSSTPMTLHVDTAVGGISCCCTAGRCMAKRGDRGSRSSVARAAACRRPAGARLSPWPDAAAKLADVAKAVARCVPAEASLLGWSLGGMVALEIARLRGAHVPGLVLVATTPKFVADAPGRMACRPRCSPISPDACATTTTGRSRTSLRCRRAATSAHSRRFARCVARSREDLRPPSRRSTRVSKSCGRATCAPTSVRSRPTLVISGERPTHAARRGELAAAMPDARHRLIRGAAHAPFLSHAHEVLDELRRFLAGPATPVALEVRA
jgi:pimeloyl-ACP methyl ester carboxylesterase